MSKDTVNIQDAFLNKIRQEGTEITLNLMNGSRVSGRITGFDKFAIVIENSNQQLMVFKHAISTINIVKRFRNTPKIKNVNKKEK